MKAELHRIAVDLAIVEHEPGFPSSKEWIAWRKKFARDWIERWDQADVEEFAAKHAAFADYCDAAE